MVTVATTDCGHTKFMSLPVTCATGGGWGRRLAQASESENAVREIVLLCPLLWTADMQRSCPRV